MTDSQISVPSKRLALTRLVPTSLLWPIVALALLLLFNLAFTPDFFKLELRNGQFYGMPIDILLRGSLVMLLSMGMALVIATGGVDLSVGAVMAIAGAVAAVLINQTENVFIAVGAALLCGIAAGLWNGVLVGFFKLQPIVATLVLMVAGRGIAQLVTNGETVNFKNSDLIFLGSGVVFGLPFPVVLAVAVFAFTALIARKTAIGLFVESVGDNEKASYYAGLDANKIKLLVYTFSGFCAALAGVVGAANIKGADSYHAGLFLELDAILAAVVGGTALTGGRFSLVGAMMGALLIQTLTTTMYARDISAEIAPLPKAIVIVLVCLLQSEKFRARVANLRPKRVLETA
jgi:ribose/xylose/arabinose/galactoside ABC-type transport system permease subunit